MKTNAAKEAEMCALRDQGLTFAEIGKRVGTSRQTAQIVVSRARRAQERLENAQQHHAAILRQFQNITEMTTLNIKT